MENQTKEQVIFFKDMLFAVLQQWKALVIAGVIGALLLGGLGILSAREPVELGGVTLTPELEGTVAVLQQRKAYLSQLIEDQSSYMASSALMNLNPSQVYTSGFCVYVQPAYPGQTSDSVALADINALLQGYAAAITDPAVLSQAEAKTGVPLADIADLISQEITAQNTLLFTVRSAGAQQAAQLRQVFLAAAQAQTGTLSQTVKAHTVSFILTQTGPGYDKDLAERQATALRSLATWESDLANIEKELTRYAPTELVAQSRSPVVYALVGGVLGVFLAALVALLGHLASDRIYSAKALAARTGVQVLGCADSGRARFPVDRWLRRLEGRSGPDTLGAIALDVRNRCSHCSHLLIMADGLPPVIAPMLLDPVVKQLEAAGKVCTLACTREEALEALGACDGVLLVPTCQQTTYSQTAWATATCRDLEKPLLGCVLMEG